MDSSPMYKKLKTMDYLDEELTLSLLKCGDVGSLGSAVNKGLRSCIPEVYGGALFYVDTETEEVFTIDNLGFHPCVPTSHCIRQAYDSKQRTYCTPGALPQCVLNHVFGGEERQITEDCTVECCPVIGDQEVYAVLVVIGKGFNESTESKIGWVQKQIAACYSHIQRTFQSQRGTEERASQQLIKLCGELYDQDASQLQLKVIRYLEEQTQAECGFLMLVVPEIQELFCQVVGKKILQEELRFPGHPSSFSVALESRQPVTLEDIPVENRKSIEELVECPLHSFLCVPVMSRSDNSLIALACLVNKRNSSRFTDRDIACIRQCFRYTATVLTSTLAFQNERKLKIQTQAMLQVARHLFTNLGEFIKSHSSGIDDFPIVRSRNCEVNIAGSRLAEALQRDTLHNIRHCRKVRSGSDLCEARSFPSIPDVNENQDKCTCSECYKTSETVETARQTQSIDVSNRGKSCVKNMTKSGKVGRHYDKSMGTCNIGTLNKEMIETINTDHNYAKATYRSFEIRNTKQSSNQEGSHLHTDLNDAKQHDHEGKNNGDELSPSGCAWFSSPHDSPSPSEVSELSIYTECFSQPVSSTSSYNELCSLKQDYFDAEDSMDFEYPSFDTDSTLSPICDQIVDQLNWEDVCFDEANAALKLRALRSSNSVPILSNIVATPIDSKPELNNAFLASDSSIANPESSTKLNKHIADMDNSISELCVQQQAMGISPGKVYSLHENPVVVVEDTDGGTCHTMESSVSLKTSFGKIQADMTEDNVDSEVSVYYRAAVYPVIYTLSDAHIADIQVPMTLATPLHEKDLTKLLREVMQQARNLTQAERCSVFLIDPETDELVAKVFDGISTNEDNEVSPVQEEIRLPSTQGIAGHVATTGELLNIKDAYSHPLFYRGIDDSTGFRTRNILCFPIKDDKGKILGVAQLCNKKNGPCFTQFDEDVATAFGIYCCISISHSLMYKKVIDSQIRNNLANELMMYHMKCLLYKKLQDSQHRKSLANELMIYHMQVCPEDVQHLSTVDIPHPRLLNAEFASFTYAPRTLPEDSSLLAVLSMFEDLNLISRWRIRRETLARFVLMVKKGYRNPPYHNWMHAYTVGQFCYQLVENLKLFDNLEEIEVYALFVACLCHDIDHRGTNNSFQNESKSTLAALYSSEGSVLERHHFAQTMCILNTEGCNIFENLSSKDYQAVLDLLRDIILATDLAHHLKILKNLSLMADRGFDKTQPKDHKLLLCLLMTACDLSDQTKPWDNTKRVAALIYKEFFSQGDAEKNLGKMPIEMMDRERAQIPELQIGFLDHVAGPVYKVLSRMFSPVQTCVDAIENNKAHWNKISSLIKLKRGGSCTRMTFDEVLAIETEDDQPIEDGVNVSNGTK